MNNATLLIKKNYALCMMNYELFITFAAENKKTVCRGIRVTVMP